MDTSGYKNYRFAIYHTTSSEHKSKPQVKEFRARNDEEAISISLEHYDDDLVSATLVELEPEGTQRTVKTFDRHSEWSL